MKHTVTIIAALLVMLSTSVFGHPDVKNSLTIKNNTGEAIQVVICWRHKGAEGWTTKGWYDVEAYKEFRTDLHDLSLDDNTMFVHAKSSSKTWGGNAEFRIDDNAFEISHADEINSKVKTAKFKSVRVGQGNTMFFINP